MPPLPLSPPPLPVSSAEKPEVKHINRRKVQEKALIHSIKRRIIRKGMNKENETSDKTNPENGAT